MQRKQLVSDSCHMTRLEVVGSTFQIVEELARLGVHIHPNWYLCIGEEARCQRPPRNALPCRCELIVAQKPAESHEVIGGEDGVRAVANPFEQPPAVPRKRSLWGRGYASAPKRAIPWVVADSERVANRVQRAVENGEVRIFGYVEVMWRRRG